MHRESVRREDSNKSGLLLHNGRSLGPILRDLPLERLWQLQRALFRQGFLRRRSRYSNVFLLLLFFFFFKRNNCNRDRDTRLKSDNSFQTSTSAERFLICAKTVCALTRSALTDASVIRATKRTSLGLNALASIRAIFRNKSLTSQFNAIIIIDNWPAIHRTSDINECELTPRPCKYNCQNTEGSFICSCPAGFILNPDGVSCRDLDECATGNHLCQQNCINTQGSYTCGCQEGYTQDGDACHGSYDVHTRTSTSNKLLLSAIVRFVVSLDINECDQPGTCPKPGTCVNTLGSFRCICPRGFKLDQSGRFCIDQNECADDNTCEHGCQVENEIEKWISLFRGSSKGQIVWIKTVFQKKRN